RGKVVARNGTHGEGARGPSLASGSCHQDGADAALMHTITDAIMETAMPGVFFSPVQVRQIIAYVRSLQQSGAQRPAGDAAHGEKLFRQSGCIGCHLVRGEGGWKGP